MAHRLPSMVRQTSTSTGLTTLVLNGAARKPYRSFASSLSNGDTTDVMVVDRATGVSQAAKYSYSSGTLTFVEFISSSTGEQVNFGAGTKDVYVSWTGARAEETLDRITTLEEGVVYSNQKANLWEFGPLTTPAEVATTFLAAATQVGDRGRGRIVLPETTLIMGAYPATAVGTDEGAGLKLTAAMSNITFVSEGRQAVLIPASNRIQMFSIEGAAKTAFDGIHFDNSDNGLLQNQFKPTTQVPGGGIAGLGNAACSAIKQFTGAGLTVRNCEFTSFHTSIGYFGNQGDINELVGDLIVDGVKFDNYVFGVLCTQPRTLLLTNFEGINGENSLNYEEQTNDPGHALYFANRNGAYPESVVVTDGRGTNNRSSLIKIRKGNSVVLGNIAVYASHRGVECWNVKALTASNISVILADVDGAIDDDGLIDTNASGFELTDCGNYELDEIFVNRSGCNAWGVRIRDSAGGQSWQNLDGRLKGVTVKDDSSASTGKAFVVVGGQTDVEIESPIARLTANVAHAKEVVDINGCTRVRVIRPKRRSAAASNPTGSDRLVNFDASSSYCTAEISREDMDVAPTTDTVIDAGTNNKTIRVDGVRSGTWTPTFAFATPGDSTVTVNGGSATYCRYERIGPSVVAFGTISITTNAYSGGGSGPSGALQMSGLPFVPGRIADAFGPINRFTNIVGTIDGIAVRLDKDSSIAVLRRSAAASTGGDMTTSQFPASTTFSFSFRLEYLVDE